VNPAREQLCGAEAIAAALDAGRALRLVLAASDPPDPATRAVVDRARAAGIEVRTTSDRSLWRLSKNDPPAAVLGLVGPPPNADLASVLATSGLVWQLTGLAYPGNTGFAIRLADVSGAAGIVVDGAFGHDGRREALRASMRADRFLPVFWQPAAETIALAHEHDRQVWAVEDTGDAAPWEVDLTRPSVLVVGGERDGIPPAILAECDAAIRIPMRGFIPSYNVQAAMAIVAGERLRQLGASDRGR